MSCSVHTQPRPGKLLRGRLRPGGTRGEPGARGASGEAGEWRRGLAFWGRVGREGGGGADSGPAELRSLNATRCFLAHLQSRRESICRLRSKGGLSRRLRLPRELRLGNRGQPETPLLGENSEAAAAAAADARMG